MAKNLHCGCLCHGSNGNRIGDEYFSCKGCYAANHMDSLPRKVVVTKAAPKRKPLKKDAPIATKPIKKFTPAQAATLTAAIKETLEAVHVCGDGANCKHDA